MKKIGALGVIAGLVLAGCGSTSGSATPATVTSVASVTVKVTTVSSVLSTETETRTQTETATATATKTAIKPVPTTVVRNVVKTVPKTVAVTVTAEPAGASVPNGDYLVGKDIEPGTYQCKDGGENLYWSADDSSGEIIDNDLGSIARFTSAAYTIKLSGCAGDWKRVG